MREKLVSIGDDSWIEDEQGERVYKVDGKALRIRDTFVLEDRDGNEVAKIQEKKLSVRDKMKVERDGRTLATVHKALVGIRDRFEIDVEDGEDLKAHGNIVAPRVRDQARRTTSSRRSQRSGSGSATPTASRSQRRGRAAPARAHGRDRRDEPPRRRLTPRGAVHVSSIAAGRARYSFGDQSERAGRRTGALRHRSRYRLLPGRVLPQRQRGPRESYGLRRHDSGVPGTPARDRQRPQHSDAPLRLPRSRTG